MGAGSELGAAVALAFAAQGAHLAIADRNLHTIKGLAMHCAAGKRNALAIACDGTREASVAEAVACASEELGGLDVAVNIAGGEGNVSPVDYVSARDWDHAVALGLRSIFLAMKHEISTMKSGGRIINLTTSASTSAARGLAPLAAAQHGVIGLTKAAALEQASAGIMVNAICPSSRAEPSRDEVGIGAAAWRSVGIMGEGPAPTEQQREIVEAVLWLCAASAEDERIGSLILEGPLRSA